MGIYDPPSHENRFGVVKNNTILISTIGWLDKVIRVPSNKDPMVIIENYFFLKRQNLLTDEPVREALTSSGGEKNTKKGKSVAPIYIYIYIVEVYNLHPLAQGPGSVTDHIAISYLRELLDHIVDQSSCL